MIDSEMTAQHYQDASQRSGLVSAFYSYLARNLTSVISKATILEVKWQSTILKTDLDIASRCEQLLIALPGPPTLLNRESGGARCPFTINQELRAMVQGLHLDSERILLKSAPLSDEQKDQLDAQREAASRIASGLWKPDSLPSVSREFLKQISKGANPLVTSKYSLCLLLMSGVPPL